MDSFQYSVEALALDQLSYATFINNIWTWIAVVSAAVSIWMIRAAASASSVSLKPATRRLDPLDPPLSELVEESSVPAEIVVPEPASTPTGTTSFPAVLECNDITKTRGKFFAVYYGDAEKDKVREDGECGDGKYEISSNSDVDDKKCRLGGGWDSVMMMRIGKVEWYGYQDFRMLDGNVVRLWDDCRRRRRSATPASGSVVVASY